DVLAQIAHGQRLPQEAAAEVRDDEAYGTELIGGADEAQRVGVAQVDGARQTHEITDFYLERTGVDHAHRLRVGQTGEERPQRRVAEIVLVERGEEQHALEV